MHPTPPPQETDSTDTPQGQAVDRVVSPAPSPGESGHIELELAGVHKVFHTKHGATEALRDINLSVNRGEFISLIGRSGCGKTTLLRILAGLIEPTKGAVEVDGRSLWRGSARDSEVIAKFGMVFQDPNLFPWYSIRDNIALPLALRHKSKKERLARAAELCELVGLKGFERALPRELSGGMRQRAAIARALSYRPSVLLMDEPFGALDALTREKMNLELQNISMATKATIVFVTHSINEAVFLADRVVLLTPRPGKLRSIVPVPLERPRRMETETEPEFQEIVRDLRRLLDEDGDQ
ncbi:MAG: ABC transporter ATP-binding protein [Micromonosporaceae bacterium]